VNPRVLRYGPAIAALSIVGACSTTAQTKSEKPRQYPMRGLVVRLDPLNNLASIKAEKVEGWMNAMTMEFPVENKKEYLSLRKGEKITAMVNVTSEGYWLTNVKERKD
jgi:Cu/Ag efflux protein CusF